MASPSDHARAALLLTNRLVSLNVEPLNAREFWALVERVRPGDLADLDVVEIASAATVEHDEAVRLRTLLDAVTALTFEEERLGDGGVSLVSALDERFPALARDRLGSACPTFLLVAGPIEWLSTSGLGVVGSREASDAAFDVARSAGRAAVGHDWSVVSGLARGVDEAAMSGGFEAGGAVVAVPADGITRAARSPDVRARVHAGELCLASPFAPTAPFRAANALGRNKIIYGLSHVAFVVASEVGSGGTWSGATEALDRGYGKVAAWQGAGGTDGNAALVARGAGAVTDVEQLFDIDPTIAAPPEQRSLFD